MRSPWPLALAVIWIASSLASASAQRTGASAESVAVSRAAAEFDAVARRLPRTEGVPTIDRAARAQLGALACRWALAIAALSPAERQAIRRRQGDAFDPRAGPDAALVGALECEDVVDRVRIQQALGAPGWAGTLLAALEEHRAAAAQLEASLPPSDAALLAALRAAQGDVRRLEAARPSELARLVGELTGQHCRSAPATLAALASEGGSEAPAPRGISALVCDAPFQLDFGIAYGIEEPYCDSFSSPRVIFLVHGARGRHRVLAELAQQEDDSWAGFQAGEEVVAIASTPTAVLFEIVTRNAEDVHHREVVVCSLRTRACRWVEVSRGETAPDYALTSSALRIGVVSVTLSDWLAGSGPSFGRAERAHDFPVPFRWAQREADGSRDTETARCTFVVRDADGTLNVRSEPDQRSRVLGTVPTGAEIRAVWATRSWLRIEQPFPGWIYRGATERRCTR